MVVFTLPSFPWVFKVIRDEFPPPKQITREEVRAKYLLVKYHDRVGRLPDALEYSDVLFPAERMDPAVLAGARALVRAERGPRGGPAGGEAPLRRAADDAAGPVAPARGPGAAVPRRCASSGWRSATSREANIFAGDLLLKNFGITGRGPGGLLRLRRDLAADRGELPAGAERAGRGRGVVGRAVVPRGRPRRVPRGVPAFPLPARAAARAVRGDARRPARPGVVDLRARRRSAPGRQPDFIPYPDEVRLGQVVG